MSSKFQFRIIRFEPDSTRGERINIGILSIKGGILDIRLVASASRQALIREYGAENEFQKLQRTLEYWISLDAESDWHDTLSLTLPRWTVSQPGHFFATTEEQYEDEISTVLDDLVAPINTLRTNSGRRRLSTELREEFEKMGVLGNSFEDFNNGMVVPRFPVKFGEAELRIDFCVRNREMYLLQAFDLSNTDLSDKIRDVASKALVFNQARKIFTGKVNAFFVVRWGDHQHDLQMTCLEIMKNYADRVVDFDEDRDRIQLLAEISRKKSRTRDLFPIPRKLLESSASSGQ